LNGDRKFEYDALGRRIAKEDTFDTTLFLWNGDVLLSETRNHSEKLYLYEPESFRPLAQIQDGQVYHYHLDHLGTPQEMTNHKGGIVWSAQYKAYGNLALNDVDYIENNLRFQGQYFDEESGLHYNRHRYYDPGTARFTTVDPIGLLGGTNNYQYAPNPTGWIDPLGLSCKETQGRYETTTIKSDYLGEDNPNDPKRWNTPMVTEYFDENKRAIHELDVNNGLIVHKKTGELFDTADAETHWGNAIFVMDENGRIFASKKQIPYELHHSSLANGKPVASAGEFNVAQGYLLEVSNQSGHYQPSQKLNNQVFDALEKKGMTPDSLDGVMRTGWKDDGGTMDPKPQKRFKEVDEWKDGDPLPDDWMDF